MASAFGKDVLRSITKKVGRFIALAAIVGLGVGFFAGLRMTAPDMKSTADQYHDSTSTMDLRIASTMGLNADDIDAIAGLDGVDQVMPAFETDAVASLNGKQHTFRIHSLPEAATGESDSRTSGIVRENAKGAYLNQLVVDEGRLPEKAGECVISADVVLETTPSIGDVITVDSGVGDIDDVLTTRTLTIVGKVHSPYYVQSASLGTSTLGSGVVQEYVYTTESTFAKDYPITEAFVTVKGAKGLHASSDAYQSLVDSVSEEIASISDDREQVRLEQLKGDAQKELDESRAEFEKEKADTEAELSDAKTKLDNALNEITVNESNLVEAQRQHDAGVSELAQKRADAKVAFESAEQQIVDSQSRIDEGRQALEQGEQQYAVGQAEYQQNQSALDARRVAYEQSGVIDPYTEAVLSATQAKLDEVKAQLAQSRTQLDQTKVQLDEGQAQIDQAKTQLQQQKTETEAAMAAAEQQLASAQQQINDGWSQIQSGKDSYASGLAEYNDGRAKADSEFAEAEQKIADAQDEIDSIERPDWLIMDRTKNVGLVSFTSDADRVDHIASVFPFIFFLVAALVALTTMTRMVDEERVLIGTYKALGYSRSRIAWKYLGYAVAASGIGSLLGILLMGKTLPIVIMYAYAIIYYVPMGSLSFDPFITALSAGLGIGITVFSTAVAAFSQLKEDPASLMQPRAPKAGKRIILERITPIWSHLSFSWKVTARNIFRYKKRFFMTLIGIAGCTALMLTGWGLRDSINDIIDTQYGQLIHYTSTITRTSDASQEDIDKIESVLTNDSVVTDFTEAYYETMLVVDEAGEDHRASIVVPKDLTEFPNVWTLRDRLSHDPIPMTADSVVVSEKLAIDLGVRVGDTLSVAAQDTMGNAENERHSLTVTGIAENYLHDYLFVGADAYREAFGIDPDYATWYACIGENQDERTIFDEQMSEIDGVKTLAYNDEIIKSYRSMLKSVDLIVVILVVAAALLAYIVLYNLTNINVEERVREIATLKVLGFTRRETYAYIFREILITVVLGCLLGLFLGIFLEAFVVQSAEVDQAMFGRIIHPMSFVISFVLTVAFACLVLFLMRHKLARIDMVESLKSTE